MEDVIDPLAKAARHHAAARAAVPTPSSTFALSTSAVHNQFCRVPKTTKTKLVGNVQIAVAAAVALPPTLPLNQSTMPVMRERKKLPR